VPFKLDDLEEKYTYSMLVTATDIKSSADNVITASSSASIQLVLLVCRCVLCGYDADLSE